MFYKNLSFWQANDIFMYENAKYIIILCTANPFSSDVGDKFSAIHVNKANNLPCN